MGFGLKNFDTSVIILRKSYCHVSKFKYWGLRIDTGYEQGLFD